MSNKTSLETRRALRINDLGMDDERLSLPLRINTSDLYDYEVAPRAILKEIAQLQRTIKPEPAPWINPEFETYIGWCHAKQDTLARRVGCDTTTVERAIKRFKDDGVIITREWRDGLGHKHTEYQVVESVVDARQRPADGSRKGNPSKKNKGSFSKEHQPTRHRAGTPHGTTRVSQPAPAVEATPRDAVKGCLVLGGCLEGVEEGVPPSAGSASPRSPLPLRGKNQNQPQNQPRNGSGVAASQNQSQTRLCVECLNDIGRGEDHHRTCKHHPKNIRALAVINKPLAGSVAEL